MIYKLSNLVSLLRRLMKSSKISEKSPQGSTTSKKIVFKTPNFEIHERGSIMIKLLACNVFEPAHYSDLKIIFKMRQLCDKILNLYMCSWGKINQEKLNIIHILPR